jgi:hypothetical protein
MSQSRKSASHYDEKAILAKKMVIVYIYVVIYY